MKSKYIIRLDDASKNMKLENWLIFQEMFLKYKINPIIAVVPDNKDLGISYDDDINNFWTIVKKWQSYGWNIAMHGHTHEIIINKGFSYCEYNKYGEFGGLSIESQKKKITKSLELFSLNNVNVDIWVAPAHNFDNNTLDALFENSQIRIISDGISVNSYFDGRFYWIPQQLWRFKFSLFGIRTICLHPNDMSMNEIEKFEQALIKNLEYIISVQDLVLSNSSKNWIDKIYAYFFLLKRKLVQKLIK